MASNRMFSDSDLEELGTQTVELLKAAIAAGDKDKATQLAQKMYDEALRTHDLYLNWLTSTLSFIGRRYGDEPLEQAMKESAMLVNASFGETWFKLEAAGDFRGKVELIADFLKMHLQPVTIVEDEEKLVFEMHPCGSGDRQVLQGLYDSPTGFLRVAKPQPMTYGQKDFPVYCCHGAINNLLSMEAGMPPLLYEDPSDDLGRKPCRFYMYKDPSKMPEELYAKVGRNKPK